jgi:hypothetical protein
MDEYYEMDGGRYCEVHIGLVQGNGMEVMATGTGSGIGVSSGGRLGAGVGLGVTGRAEKRRTRMVELPVGGFGV